MHFYAETLGLSDSAFVLLRNLIHEHTGLFFENGRRDSLADKLSPLVVERGFNSMLDYYYLLKYDDLSGQEWDRVMNVLSVPETYFWREMDQIRAMIEVLVPQYFAANPGRPLRLWSAACASGEEPLTIAMALNEAGWFERGPIEIYASDASSLVLEKAKRGLYAERSFRTLPTQLRHKYFVEQSPGLWQVEPTLHQRIMWTKVNLMQPAEVARFATAPIIFCRNVFIYFSEETIRRTVRQFYTLMPDPGYLCLAAAESLLKLNTNFELQAVNGAFVYVKGKALPSSTPKGDSSWIGS